MAKTTKPPAPGIAALTKTRKRDDSAKRLAAVGIFVRHIIEGKTLLQSWREVKLESKANDQTAKNKASDLLKWYRETYPHDMRQALDARGLDDDLIAQKIHELLEAKTKDRWGEIVADNRTQIEALKLLMSAAPASLALNPDCRNNRRPDFRIVYRVDREWFLTTCGRER